MNDADWSVNPFFSSTSSVTFQGFAPGKLWKLCYFFLFLLSAQVSVFSRCSIIKFHQTGLQLSRITLSEISIGSIGCSLADFLRIGFLDLFSPSPRPDFLRILPQPRPAIVKGTREVFLGRDGPEAVPGSMRDSRRSLVENHQTVKYSKQNERKKVRNSEKLIKTPTRKPVIWKGKESRFRGDGENGQHHVKIRYIYEF